MSTNRNHIGISLHYFLFNALACVLILIGVKFGLDALARAAPVATFRDTIISYYRFTDSLRYEHYIFGVSKLHCAVAGIAFMFPFSRLAIKSIITTVINAPLIIPITRLMYYRFMGFLLALILSPVLGPLGILIVLKRYFQSRKLRKPKAVN